MQENAANDGALVERFSAIGNAHAQGDNRRLNEKMLVASAWVTVTSWIPRTSPTFQSCLGLSGLVSWQLKQAELMMIGEISRTRPLRRDQEVSVRS